MITLTSIGWREVQKPNFRWSYLYYVFSHFRKLKRRRRSSGPCLVWSMKLVSGCVILVLFFALLVSWCLGLVQVLLFRRSRVLFFLARFLYSLVLPPFFFPPLFNIHHLTPPSIFSLRPPSVLACDFDRCIYVMYVGCSRLSFFWLVGLFRS